jgi:hypothetical protein
MQKLEGVDSVRVSLKEGLTILELRPNNKITLAQLRTVIKNNGFVSKEAHITARASLVRDHFEVSGTAEQLRVSGKPTTSADGRWQFVSPPK